MTKTTTKSIYLFIYLLESFIQQRIVLRKFLEMQNIYHMKIQATKEERR